jgi:hypothetical protein
VCAAFGGGGAFARSRDFALARENADFSPKNAENARFRFFEECP